MNRQLMRWVLVLGLVALLVSVSPIAWADGPDTDYAHEFQGVAAEGLAGEQLSKLVYEAIESALPDVNLSGYEVTATSRILGQEGGYTVETVAALSSKTVLQTEVIGVLATYDLTDGTWQVLEFERNYVEPAEAADFGGAEEESYLLRRARAVVFAPMGWPSTWAAKNICKYFQRRGEECHKYTRGEASESTAWKYVKYAKGLGAWWHLAHGLTQNRDGAECYGFHFHPKHRLGYGEFENLTEFDGLKNTVLFMSGCNTYMDPIRSAVTGGHQARTYIGGKKILRHGPASWTGERFWYYVLQKKWTMGRALYRAQKDFNVLGYYGLWGDMGVYEVPKGKVLIDVSHNSYYKDRYLTLLPQYLQAAGFVVDKRTSGTISADILKPYCAYLIYLPMEKFSSAEKTAIKSYVRNGGSVAVVGDWGSSEKLPPWWRPANNLGHYFGVPFAQNWAKDPTNCDGNRDHWIYFYRRNFNGPITEPLTTVEAFATATLKPTVSGVQVIKTDSDASPPNRPIFFSRQLGKGRVIVLGDSDFWSDPWWQSGKGISAEQNRKLALRAVRWLCTGKASSSVAESEAEAMWEDLILKFEQVAVQPPPAGDTPWGPVQ